jgi:hypothetical protein
MSLVTPDDVRWMTYGNYEGPIYVGKHRYVLPPNASVREKFLKIITSAEGDRYDAVNMYDRAGVSLGLIQWSEIGTFNATRLLGKVCVRAGERTVAGPLAPAMALSNASFKQNHEGKWRFFVDDVEVQSPDQLRSMLCGCSGMKGTWGAIDSEQRVRAKTWAAGFANVWNNAVAREVQVELATAEMINYAFGASRKTMFGDVAEVLSAGIVGATRAIYLMYAINLPAVADSMCQRAVAITGAEKWSYEWCMDVIGELVHGPSISIYVHRYNAAKSTVESLFNVSLPDVNDLPRSVAKQSSGLSSAGQISTETFEHGMPLSRAAEIANK